MKRTAWLGAARGTPRGIRERAHFALCGFPVCWVVFPFGFVPFFGCVFKGKAKGTTNGKKEALFFWGGVREERQTRMFPFAGFKRHLWDIFLEVSLLVGKCRELCIWFVLSGLELL